MAKYTSDANLIKGAATAYRNYDNVAGMYAGLDKVTKAGTDMISGAVEGYEAEQERVKKEQEKLEEEARKEQEKADKLNNNWNTLAGGVYESAGSFMKDVEYKDTVASVKALRQEYIDAQNSKDAEKMAEVKIKFNNINTEVNAHKEFRALLTNPEYGMSDFVKGDNLEYMNGFINEDYVIGRNDKKEKTYTVNGVTKTMKEINEMVGVKDNVPYGKYGKLVNDYSKSKTKGDRNSLELGIRNGVVPDNTNGLRAFLNDDGFGNGQTFSDLLNADGNKASIEKEIMNTIFDDGDGVITRTEYDNFVNAIVSPDNEFWKNNGGASAWKNQARRIATEQLANGAENAWTDNPANKPVVTTPVGTGTGFLATANTKKPKGVSSGTLGRSFGYNVAKNMYDQFKLSSEGKPAEFSIGQTYYNYDVENNNWIQTTSDGTKKDLGDINAALGPKGFAIVDPDFMALRTTTAEITEDSDVDFDITDTKLTKSQEAGTASVVEPKINMSFVNKDDNDVADQLQNMMPTAFDVEKNPLGYKFMNLKSVGAFSGEVSSMGDFTKEGVGLYSDDGKTHITYPVGHEKDVDKNGNPGEGKIPVIISLGSDEETRKEAIATIDSILNTPEFKISGFKSKLK